MKLQLIILLTFAWINIFASKCTYKDTTKVKFNIKISSRILAAIDKHIKYDEFYYLYDYMADTMFMVIDRIMYKCNPAFAIETLQKVRSIVKNNNYKYKLITKEENTYDYIYYGYLNHTKYEVTLEFVEANDKIVFIAVIASAMDDD